MSKFFPSTAEAYKSLRLLTSVKAMWTWNASYHKLFDKEILVIKEDACIKFYNEMKPLYVETDASREGLGSALLKAREGTCCPRDETPDNNILGLMAFMSRSLSTAERRYSNVEREVLAILHGLKKLQHYCFSMEVSIITDQKSLVAIFKKRYGHIITYITGHATQDPLI